MNHTIETCREDSFSALHGETYELHHQVLPKENDILLHTKSGRQFTIGKVEGFVNYHAPLLENGKQVALIIFEDYYKD